VTVPADQGVENLRGDPTLAAFQSELKGAPRSGPDPEHLLPGRRRNTFT